LPQLLELSGEQRARELLENIEVSAFPHISDSKARESIYQRHRDRLPKPPPAPPKSAEEQYEAQRARMMGG
jgi:hypothetical protein